MFNQKIKMIITSNILLFFIVGIANATIFLVGGQKLEIPAPKGFVQVTSEMDAIYRWQQQIDITDSGSNHLAYYIDESGTPVAESGGIPLLKRYYSFCVIKELENKMVNSNCFAAFKKYIKPQLKEIFKSIEPQIPNLVEKLSKNISKEFDTEISVKVQSMNLLDLYYETNNTFSYSIDTTYEESNTVYITTTYVNVADKLILLNCCGEQEDLEWTRNTSKVWADSIIASNTQPLPHQSNVMGISWDDLLITAKEVTPKAFLTAIILALFSLIYHKFKKKD